MSAFRICTLASGSSGNAVYAESEEGALIIDAGLSGKRIEESIRMAGGSLDRVRGVIVTHDHSDHVKSAGVLGRRHGFPLMMTEGTFEASRSSMKKVNARLFRAGAVLDVAGFQIHTIATPHDAHDPVGLVIERNHLRCGVLTDLGHCFPGLDLWLQTLDAVVLESNYDPQMLKNGPYPAWLQARIRGAHGHIANAEAGELVRDHGHKLQVALLAHLSENNNHPEVAERTVREVAAERIHEQSLQLCVAPRHVPSPMVMVQARV